MRDLLVDDQVTLLAGVLMSGIGVQDLLANKWTIPLTVVLLSGIIAAVTDIWKFKVYNLLTLPLLVSGVLYHSAAYGVDGLVFGLLGAALGFAVLLIPYLMGGVGAGDVKLMAGVGAWFGFWATFCVFVVSALGMGLYALVLIVRHGRLRQTVANLQILFYQAMAMAKHLGPDERIESVVKQADRRRRLVPFATMVPLGVIALVFLSQLYSIWTNP